MNGRHTAPQIAADISKLLDRIRRIERANRHNKVDANGAPWDAANPAWIDPATQAAWAELHVANTDDGSHIFRNCDSQWKKIT